MSAARRFRLRFRPAVRPAAGPVVPLRSSRRASARASVLAGKPAVVLAIVSCLILSAGVYPGTPARAESLWGMEGLGYPETPYDHAARGAGSTAIGVVDDPYGMSFANPAAIAHAQLPQAHFGLVGQDRWIRDAAGASDRRMDMRVTMGRAVLPGPGPLRWSFGYRDLTDGSYQVSLRSNRGREDEYVRKWTGSGGVGELSAGLAASMFAGRLAAGLQFGFANGTLQEIVEDQYVSGSYLERRDILRTRVLDGHVLALGTQVVPWPGLSFGAAWRRSSPVDLRALSTSADEVSWEERASFDLPTELGLGLAVHRSRFRLAADWNRANWSQGSFTTPSGQTTASLGTFRDTNRLGLGVTMFPPVSEAKGPLLHRTVWRAGFTWGQLPVRQRPAAPGVTGASVSEWALTGGWGLPIKADRGWVDLFFEGGRTGNLGEVRLRETFLRLGAGVTFGRFEKSF